jgi:hypothetical protein
MGHTTEIYRSYEPGYSKQGRINDLSPHFQEMPLVPRDLPPTVETWKDGRPKGIGMLFRSFIESSCYAQGEVRCYDCHDPHANKEPIRPGLFEPSAVSDAYCLKCHRQQVPDIAAHTHHPTGQPGSFCYDCHMPRHIHSLESGERKVTRSHTMSSVPRPQSTIEHGAGAPNACNDCHADQSPHWALGWMERWWPKR